MGKCFPLYVLWLKIYKNSISWVVSKRRYVNGVNNLWTTERHFGSEKDIINNVRYPNFFKLKKKFWRLKIDFQFEHFRWLSWIPGCKVQWVHHAIFEGDSLCFIIVTHFSSAFIQSCFYSVLSSNLTYMPRSHITSRIVQT
jgi:hypothetical protein